MITNFASRTDASVVDCDIAIVGGGPAGLCLASEFIGRRERVVMLEAGDLDLDARFQNFARGSGSGTPYFALDESRYRMLGGSTFRWGARSAPFKPLDFAARPWLPHSGWPIDLDSLAPYYAKVFDIVGVHSPFAFDEQVWRYLSVKPAAFDPAKLDYHAFQFGTNLLLGSLFRDRLKAAANVEVWLAAQLLTIETNAARDHVTGLTVGHVDGRRATLRAKHYVLAAGGIENARLLLLSDVANASDAVGRYFMEHPTVSAGQVVGDDLQKLVDNFSPGLAGGRLVEVGVALTPDRQRETETLAAIARTAVVVGNDATQALRELLRNLKHRRLPHQLSWYQKNKWLTDRLTTIARDPFSVVSNAVRHRLGRPKRFKLESVYLEVRTEQEPNPDSRVTLGAAIDAFGQRRAHLHWVLTPRDKRTMRVVAEEVDAEFRRLGLGHIDFAPWLLADDLGFGDDLVGGHHHMGTTRMSLDPQTGVVDADCRTHGLDNLYVAGSSVFPTASFVNPTATLMALSLRLAGHLQRAGA